jgi:hypothetical protein
MTPSRQHVCLSHQKRLGNLAVTFKERKAAMQLDPGCSTAVSSKQNWPLGIIAAFKKAIHHAFAMCSTGASLAVIYAAWSRPIPGYIDQILREAWDRLPWARTHCLLAVGGYGRGELRLSPTLIC